MVRDRIARDIRAADPPLLIIDMADVTLCDSAGLSLFVSVHRSIKVLGGRPGGHRGSRAVWPERVHVHRADQVLRRQAHGRDGHRRANP
ncbi:STAS domain-containing protein [Nonomuraea dietziae]|uniref:STAS domain-containing protein n=1 Tax=Nonomuraea dietziae TaxID=65515 RepID=UPI0031D99C0E